MTNELDDDLQGLLDQLDEQDEFIEEPVEEEQKKPDVKDLAPSEVVVQPEETGPPSDMPDVREYGEELSAASLDDETTEQVPLVLQKYIDRMDDVTNEVLQACRSDRQEVQNVINTCQKEIEDAKAAKHPPARMWVDGLVKAVEVKGGINSTAVKMVEANIKLLAATKAGVQINQQINAGGNVNLDEVLSEPLGDDDEY